MNTWIIQKKPIVVGLQLDNHHGSLLRTTVSLARRLGSGLEAVHCFEEPIEFGNDGGFLPRTAHGQHQAISSTSEKHALQWMRALTDEMMSQVDIHVHLEKGTPSEDLTRIAREVGAGLIVCGLKNYHKARTFKGISTALSLAFYAPVPVLILSLAAEIDFEKPVNVLLCDTLGGEGSQVLESGLQFANAIDTRTLFHTHILKATRRSIDDALAAINETSVKKPLGKSGLSTEELEHSLAARIKDELLYRFHSTTSASGCTDRYHPLVAIGDLDDEIFRMIDKNRCDLVIIGRDQFLARNNIAMDRIPYRALLERNIGLLVLPDCRPPLQRWVRNGLDKADVDHGLIVQ